ncbi:histidine phosphatase family protein [bacterium]|nr:histidine phosphatase family protein [bacterium]
MKKTLALLVVLILTIGVQSALAQQVEKTTCFLIRHAEKIKTTDPNPQLTEEGEKRAVQWSKIFASVSLDAVYSTNYQRTLATAGPTAESQGLEIQLYQYGKIDYKQFMSDTKGLKILIVGHSNTIPEFVNILIGHQKYQDIEHTNNSNLYIVENIDGKISDLLLHIN